MLLEESATTRVQRGYEWLKTEGPKHGLDVTKLNPSRLQTRNADECPLAHASGSTYGAGMYLADRSLDTAWAIAHGFWELPGDVGVIDKIWRDVIIADRHLHPTGAAA